MRTSAIVIAALLILIGCGGGGGSAVPRAMALVAGAPNAPAASPAPPPWPSFAHDASRTAFQPSAGPLSRATLSRLKARWTFHDGAEISASPIVANGMVYVGDVTGMVSALDERSGVVRWQTHLPGPYIRMTPTFMNGELFVGTRPSGQGVGSPEFAALDATSGNVIWSVPADGVFRAEPVVDGPNVYMGLAEGDPPFCKHGGVTAYNALSGMILWQWYVSPVAGEGGSVWSPITMLSNLIVFGTGNVCTGDTSSANGIVALHLDGSLAYEIRLGDGYRDDDVGGGVTVLDPHFAVVPSKDDDIVAFDPSTGTTLWRKQFGVTPDFGSIGTAATDGQRIYISNGFMHNPYVVSPPGGELLALDRSGNVLWRYDKATNAINGAPALTKDLLFLDVDSRIVALDPASGAELWTFPTAGTLYASPAIAPSGVYTADQQGNVYALSIDGQ
jgi:outer membrane protein assembly factor BamB